MRAPAQTARARQVDRARAPEKGAGASTGASTAAGDVASTATAGNTDTEQMPSVDLEVLFEYKSARIDPAATATLTTLRPRPHGRAPGRGDAFLIAGHTDAKRRRRLQSAPVSSGARRRTARLSCAEFGIDQKRLVAQGFGQRRLKRTRKIRWMPENRRVQIINFTPPKPQ